MIQFCIFGGHEGMLAPSGRLYVTIFGGCELTKPTFARLLAAQRRGESSGRNWSFFLTLFGATELKCPTLVDEYLDLISAVRSGLLTFEQWDQSTALLNDTRDQYYTSFTLFAGLSVDELATEDQELDAIALQRHLQQLPDGAASVLMMAVGQRGARRLQAVRQAAATALRG